MNPKASLRITQLRKSYGHNEILKGISLDIQKGEFVSLLGPSGSGKTTILRCLAGLETPQGGSIELDGQVLSDKKSFVPPERRQLGMVFQSYAIWPHMNVAANVAFPLTIRGDHAPQDIKKKVKDALALVRLDSLGERFAHELSGGQQQRVALARALVMSPRALLLDEPLSNLDALLREELSGEIRKLQQELGLTTILVTHDRKEALSMSDRIVLLNNGVIEASGTPEDLYFRPPTPFAAAFIAGAQTMGAGELLLPRRWKIDPQGREFRVTARLFLGSEYEYWGEGLNDQYKIRFFAGQKVAPGEVVRLNYANAEA